MPIRAKKSSTFDPIRKNGNLLQSNLDLSKYFTLSFRKRNGEKLTENTEERGKKHIASMDKKTDTTNKKKFVEFSASKSCFSKKRCY